MYRYELTLTDSQIIANLAQGWHLSAAHIDYVDIGGGSFGFKITTTEQQPYFLKIYEKGLYPYASTAILNQLGTTLHKFKYIYGLKNIVTCIATTSGTYCWDNADMHFVLYEYIAGYHPSYEPNQLHPEKLAQLFSQLHQLPPQQFPEIERERFSIEFALGLRTWLNPARAKHKMLQRLEANRDQLIAHLAALESLQTKAKAKPCPFVITHGDGHHYNILQNEHELWLVDWDDLKIGPVERDLWHHENSAVITKYHQLSPNFHLDLELCRFYQLERFLSDLRYYLDKVLLNQVRTPEQASLEEASFLQHWGWQIKGLAL